MGRGARLPTRISLLWLHPDRAVDANGLAVDHRIFINAGDHVGVFFRFA
jgi:hypothetical protein